VLRPELSPEEHKNIITTLLQFPLFAPGRETGKLTFEHELIGEYLTGRYLLDHISNKDKTAWVASSLGERIEGARSFILRYLANKILRRPEIIQIIIATLRQGQLQDPAFARLLQLFLLVESAPDTIKGNRIALEGKTLRYVQFRQRELSGVSFRNCDLSDSTFDSCNLQNASFEGAILSGTRFEGLPDEALKGARFGNLERFQSIYIGRQRIDEPKSIIEWMRKATDVSEPIQEPCPTAYQLKTLFLKFITPKGEGKRDQLKMSALLSGKLYPGAPRPERCIDACLSFGYMEDLKWHGYIRRQTGELYDHMVDFVTKWNVSPLMRELLDSLCRERDCKHVPARSKN
jgi:hypothetical protein